MNNFKINHYYKPVCLYTYATCIVSISGLIVTIESSDDTYDYISSLCKRHFNNRIDNKITIEFKHNNGAVIYLSYWDGKINIGTEVRFFINMDEPFNSYRVVLAS